MTDLFDKRSDTRRGVKVDTKDKPLDDTNISAQSTYDVTRQSARGTTNDLTNRQQRALTLYNHVTYLLYVLSYFTVGLLWVVPIVMNYGKRHDADNTWLATHFDWQIKTFWYSIVWFVIGGVLVLFALGGFGISMISESDNIAIGAILMAGLGLLILLFTFIWHLYRIVRGWIALTDKRPVP